MNLKQKIAWSWEVLYNLPRDQSYTLAFSGGKDSHVLLGIYLQWVSEGNEPLDLTVVFADTEIENPLLYDLINLARQRCTDLGISFVIVSPELKNNFWVLQFGRGYAVPDYRNRWCTSKLKVRPINKIKGTSITGAHLGESKERDRRINCGSGECGIDKLSGTIEPISIWSNCDVWDWIALHGDQVFYEGFINSIHQTYQISESSNGLRFGCFLCPVIGLNTLKNNVDTGMAPPISMEVRRILESLRKAPRVNNQRTGKAGAISVDARIQHWEMLRKHLPTLLKYRFITIKVVAEVQRLLKARSYPVTYKQDWIDSQEAILAKQPKYYQLDLLGEGELVEGDRPNKRLFI